jgi:deoxycytidine triphosphate deaminase
MRESIRCSIQAYNELSYSQILSNVINNGFGISTPNTCKLTLTDDKLHIESFNNDLYTNYNTTVSSIDLANIKTFDVFKDKDDEIINISLYDNRKISFVKPNDNGDNLGAYMASLIKFH